MSGGSYILDENLNPIKNTNPLPVDIRSIQPGTNQIGKIGLKEFKVITSFTRPNDSNIYTINDAITNSTTSPTVLSFDLASQGGLAGKAMIVTNARVISSVKAASISLNANIWIFNQTFAATNDNAELSIDDTTATTGGVVIPCLNTYSTALNHRCVSDPGWWEAFLGAADTNIYFTLQAANGYTPTSGEVFTVVLEGFFA